MTLTLLLATNNPHKVKEFRSIFLPYAVILQTPADLGMVTDVDESGNTYFENARLKAQAYWQEGQNMVLADDSGLEVEALVGAPASTRTGSCQTRTPPAATAAFISSNAYRVFLVHGVPPFIAK